MNAGAGFLCVVELDFYRKVQNLKPCDIAIYNNIDKNLLVALENNQQARTWPMRFTDAVGRDIRQPVTRSVKVSRIPYSTDFLRFSTEVDADPLAMQAVGGYKI